MYGDRRFFFLLFIKHHSEGSDEGLVVGSGCVRLVGSNPHPQQVHYMAGRQAAKKECLTLDRLKMGCVVVVVHH